MDLNQLTNPDGSQVQHPNLEDFDQERWIFIDMSDINEIQRNTMEKATGVNLEWICLLVQIPQTWDSVTTTTTGIMKRGHSFAYAVSVSDPVLNLEMGRHETVLLKKWFNLSMEVVQSGRIFRYAVYDCWFEKFVEAPWKSEYPVNHIHRPLQQIIHRPEFLIYDVQDHHCLQLHIKEYIQSPLPNYEIGYAVVFNPDLLESRRYSPYTTRPTKVKVYIVGREMHHPPILIPGAFTLNHNKAREGKFLHHGVMEKYLRQFSDQIARDHVIQKPEEPPKSDFFEEAIEMMSLLEKNVFSCVSLKQLSDEVFNFIGKSNHDIFNNVVKELQMRMEARRNRYSLSFLFIADEKRIRKQWDYVQFVTRVQMGDVDFVSKYLIQAYELAFQ